MIDVLKGISNDEYKKLKESISLITILIADADGNIDEKEIEHAHKIAHIRSYFDQGLFNDFYADVDDSFESDLNDVLTQFDANSETRRVGIINKLKELNTILPKIESPQMRYAFYKSLLTFAKQVAKSSGGILGWGSIGPKEEKLISLDFIHKIEEPLEEEEES